MRNQIRVSLDDRGKNILDKVKEDNNFSNYNEAISYLCEEYLSNERIKLSEERIALRVKKELSKDLILLESELVTLIKKLKLL